jgi:hypothetical protein
MAGPKTADEMTPPMGPPVPPELGGQPAQPYPGLINPNTHKAMSAALKAYSASLPKNGAPAQSVGASVGGFAQAAAAALRQQKPHLFNSDGAFNWDRAGGEGWAPEVIKA